MSASCLSSEPPSPNSSFLPNDSNLFASFVADAILTRIHASIDSMIANRHEVLEQRLAQLLRVTIAPRLLTDDVSLASVAGSQQEVVSGAHSDLKRKLPGSRAQTLSTRTSLRCQKQQEISANRRSTVPNLPLPLDIQRQTLFVPSPETSRTPTLPTLLNRISDNPFGWSRRASTPLPSRGTDNYKKEEGSRPGTGSPADTIDIKTLQGIMALQILQSVDLMPASSQIKRVSSKSRGDSERKQGKKALFDILGASSVQDAQDANGRLAWENCPSSKEQSDATSSYASFRSQDLRLPEHGPLSQADRDLSQQSLPHLSLDQVGSMVAESASPKGGPTARQSIVSRMEDLRRWRASDLTRGIGVITEGGESSLVGDFFDVDLAQEELIEALGKPAPMMLRLCGICPWTSCERHRSSMWCFSICYKWAVVLLCICTLLVYIKRLLCLDEDIDDRRCRASQQQLLSDLPLAVGSIAGLVSLGVLRCNYAEQVPDHNTYIKDMSDCRELLISYLVRAQLFEEWRAWLRWDLMGMLLIWVSAVAERARASGIFSIHTMEVLEMLHIVSFAICSGVIMGLAFCLLYVCRALRLMVDNFCTRIVGTPHVLQAVQDWNVLQAVLRRASNSVEHCFFVMQAAAFSAVLLSIIDATQADAEINRSVRIHPTALIPGALIALGIGRVFFSAAAVTDKCHHVPSWVNSLTFDTGLNMDLERQYVVDYIIHSNAGFYIFEVRLSSVLALKVTYLMCAVAFALASHLLRHFPRAS